MFKMLCLALVVFHGTSFSMIVQYKNKENKEIFEASTRKYATRIAAQFAQEERERWAKLPQEEQDFCKLEKIYRNQDNPKLVANLLKKYSVPVLIMGNSQKKVFWIINPYNKNFYDEPDKQIYMGIEVDIESRFEMRKAIIAGVGVYKGSIECPLVSSIIFGKDKDILRALSKVDELHPDHSHTASFGGIITALNYRHREKNNALELLLSHERARTKNWNQLGQRIVFSNAVLITTAYNKELFELICNKDPYNCNRELFTESEQPMTMLERIKQDKDTFDQEHIDIFMREGGGMTVAEVQDMQKVERILNNQTTHQEVQQRDILERHMTNMNSVDNNKYLESLRIQRIREEDQIIENAMNMIDMILEGLLFENFLQRRNI
jgi:hypothetical protein